MKSEPIFDAIFTDTFKPGDKVIVKKNPGLSTNYRWYRIWEGKDMTISTQRSEDSYVVKENDFYWKGEYLEHAFKLPEELFEI